MLKPILVKINLIQDLPTPHNNVLIGAFKKAAAPACLNLWYAREGNTTRYKWTKNLAHEHFEAQIYGDSLNWGFLRYCLSHRAERYVIVGWANANTRLLHLLFFLLRRPYNHWTDLLSVESETPTAFKRFVRWAAYGLLRYSKATILCVGVTTLEYFRKRRFPESRLVNLPIFVECDENLAAFHALGEAVFKTHGISGDEFVITAGSRVVREKGFDLLIKAVSHIDSGIRDKMKLMIVGSGPARPELEAMVAELGLNKITRLIDWLDVNDFKALIANSHVFIHPARADSYGGTALGMALGVPVIGSRGAGAAVDRIVHGENGFLYEPEDTRQLAKLIERLYHRPEERLQMAAAALQTAKSWPPERGVDILMRQTI